MRANLTARPAGYDYAKEILARLSGGVHPIRLDAIPLGQGVMRQSRLERIKPFLLGAKLDYVQPAQATNPKPYPMVGGVAMVDICGYLSSQASWWDESGYDDIESECLFAMTDPDCNAVALMLNSPGGEADGSFECADAIAKLAAAKPTWSIVDTMAYSSAYMQAAQANQIIVPPVSGGVGSIGVRYIHADISAMLEKAGIKMTMFTAGDGKGDLSQYFPLTDEVKARVKATIDRLYGEFTSRVSTGRKMSEADVIELGAFLYDGPKAAISSRLADRAQSAVDSIIELAAIGAAQKSAKQVPAASAGKTKGARMDNVNNPIDPAANTSLPAPTAEQTDALIAEAKTAGYVDAELVLNLCNLGGATVAETHAFIKAKKSPMEVSAAILAAKAAKTDTHTQNGAILPEHASGADKKPAKTESLADRQRAKVEAENKRSKKGGM